MTLGEFFDSLGRFVKKVLQLNFSNRWDSDGCLPHIVQAWVRNARNYEHTFASSDGPAPPGIVEGRPHFGFHENARANRVFNKILRWNRNCFFSLRPIIERVRPDILHFHNRHDLVDQVVISLSYRPKVVSMYHRLYNKLYAPATADLLLGVGKSTATWIDRKVNPVIPLAVVHPSFQPMAPRTAASPARPFFLTYLTDPGPTRDLYAAVAALHAEGLDFEVKAFGQRFSQYPPPAGVTVSGRISQAEFVRLGAEASAYLCLTYGTAFSVAVLEAMAQRTPVLTPWDIGALDLLPPGCVISFESFSPVAMADAIRLFLKMPEDEKNAMTARALTAASTAYDEATVTRKLERLYDALFT